MGTVIFLAQRSIIMEILPENLPVGCVIILWCRFEVLLLYSYKAS